MAEGSGSIPENIPEIATDTSIREDLVATAVKFLQNPKVQSSPMQQKTDFMKKKGLTDEEIAKAIKLSGVSETAVAPVLHQHIPSNLPAPAAQPVSGWSRFREYFSLFVIVTGVVYGLYSLYKKYIEPMFLRRYKEQDEKLGRLEKGINDLSGDVNKNLENLQSSVQSLRDQLTDQSLKLASVSASLSDYKDSSTSGSSSTAINSIQTELASLKALLLSTKQFPSTPTVPPVIPSWQMKPKSSPVVTNQILSRGDASSVDTTENRSFETQPLQAETSSSTLVVKKVSKADLERESDEDANADESVKEFQSEKTQSPATAQYSYINGHTDEDGKNVSENSPLFGGTPKQINGSPIHSVFSHSIPDKNKVAGESELD